MAAILNGLGATKYEELFIVWRTVAQLLDEAGIEVVAPEVGELVTSLDMAGCSLTLTWLDEELERLWHAPVDTPAYRKGSIAPADMDTADELDAPETVDAAAPTRAAGPDGRRTAHQVARALRGAAEELDRESDRLGELDAIAGDGDHGRGMARGSAAAAETAEETAERGVGPADVLTAAGDAWAGRAGGTSGALWGAALAAFGENLPDDRAVTASDLSAAADAAANAVRRLGRAEPGDKTLLDALVPFAEALRPGDSAAEPCALWRSAAATAERAAEATAELEPKTGRARPLAERSRGTPDPGATSLAMVVTRVGAVLHESDPVA